MNLGQVNASQVLGTIPSYLLDDAVHIRYCAIIP